MALTVLIYQRPGLTPNIIAIDFYVIMSKQWEIVGNWRSIVGILRITSSLPEFMDCTSMFKITLYYTDILFQPSGL